MTRTLLRPVLTCALLAAAAFAAWSWMRPYAWNPDPAAHCEIEETLVTRDLSFYWIDIHLKVIPGMSHDLQQPVSLETSAGKMLEPADTTFSTGADRQPTEIWFKFWLESADLAGDLTLHLDGGTLRVKSGKNVPRLEIAASRNFTNHHW